MSDTRMQLEIDSLPIGTLRYKNQASLSVKTSLEVKMTVNGLDEQSQRDKSKKSTFFTLITLVFRKISKSPSDKNYGRRKYFYWFSISPWNTRTYAPWLFNLTRLTRPNFIANYLFGLRFLVKSMNCMAMLKRFWLRQVQTGFTELRFELSLWLWPFIEQMRNTLVLMKRETLLFRDAQLRLSIRLFSSHLHCRPIRKKWKAHSFREAKERSCCLINFFESQSLHSSRLPLLTSAGRKLRLNLTINNLWHWSEIWWLPWGTRKYSKHSVESLCLW